MSVLSVFSQESLLGNELDESEVPIGGRALLPSAPGWRPSSCPAQLSSQRWRQNLLCTNSLPSLKAWGPFWGAFVKMLVYGEVFCGRVTVMKRRDSQACSEPGRASPGTVPDSHTALLTQRHPDQQQPCCSGAAGSGRELSEPLTSEFMWWRLYLCAYQWHGQNSS